MFCPQCHAEYRQGFTRCHDCDVDLVYELNAVAENEDPSAPALAEAAHELRVLWRDTNQESCIGICYKLRGQGIPYKVKETAGSVGIEMRAARRYELSVSSEDYQRAKATLQVEDDLPETISEDEWKELERPKAPDEQDEVQLQGQYGVEASGDDGSGTGDSKREQQSRREAYFRPWYPEDATTEIWSQRDDVDFSGAIEMALRENLIRCRLEVEGAVQRVFVLPEQETRAREIVRQIIKGV